MSIGPEPVGVFAYDEPSSEAGIWVCPFCGNELRDEREPCCGEVGHAEWYPCRADADMEWTK